MTKFPLATTFLCRDSAQQEWWNSPVNATSYLDNYMFWDDMWYDESARACKSLGLDPLTFAYNQWFDY